MLWQAGSGLVRWTCVEAALPLGPDEGEGSCSVWKQREGRRARSASPALAAAPRRQLGNEAAAWKDEVCVPALAGAAEESLGGTEVPRTLKAAP